MSLGGESHKLIKKEMGQKQSTVSNTESESKLEKDVAPLCADAVLSRAEPQPQGLTAQRQMPTLIHSLPGDAGCLG